MSVDLDHASMPGAPTKSEITWTGPMPFFLDSTISSEFLTMPLFDGLQEWSMSGSSPGAAAAAASGRFDGFQQQPHQQQKQAHPSPPPPPQQQAFMNAYIEPNLFSPDQPMPPHVHQHQPHLAPKEPLLDPTMHPFAASPTSSYPIPMHEITSRGSISDQSHRSSYGSISSSSSSSSSSTTGYNAVEQQKRERFLERNRVAANKCRRKKKEHTRQLESRCMEVTQANSQLESEVSQLRSQILELKNELLRHSGCDDPAIKAHLARMVAHLSQRSASVSGASEASAKEDGGPRGRSSRSTPLSPAHQSDAKQEVEPEAAFGFDDMLHLGDSKADEQEEEEEVRMQDSP
ncbi:hypothetical protein BO86DRAFT_146108 [Aspergillus japonicus CBS 114.51]|uniref:BZIP domain-containing protein n=1 Tax=Aspergillus japonicus CBS 114.51 TaxID=1448312 RepID=A0A8T8WV86_ASPJA|nr:hypothetical protein BO86DRAFT_146108 [Aspergillus japonicus CBS 114.51]RAH79713.1 hypothetical protein BO86DRAFT_146108 [Aspergillus japonicus CBS 114.51]